MAWLKLGLVLFAFFANITAQQGYNYERPQRPFEPTPYQTGQQSGSPTTKQNGGFVSGYRKSDGIPIQQLETGQKIGTSPLNGGYPESPTASGYQKSNEILEGGRKIATVPSGYPGSFPPTGGYPSAGFQKSTPVSGGYPESPGFQKSNGILEEGRKTATSPSGYPGPVPPSTGYQKLTPTGPSFPVTGGYPESPTAPGYQKSTETLQGDRKTATVPPGYPAPSTGYQKSTPIGPSLPGSGGFPDLSSQKPDQFGNIFQTPSFRPFPGQQNGNFTLFGQTPIRPFVNGQEEINEGDYSAIPGVPDQDYPIYSEIPTTSFSCDDQQYPGYYADTETRCQVFHICANNETYNFLCPNGTVFHQEYLVCVWWNQFDCSTAPSLYSINANIYDYTIMGVPQYVGGRFPGQGLGGPPGSTDLNQPNGYQEKGPFREYPTQGLISPLDSPGATQPGGSGSDGYPGATLLGGSGPGGYPSVSGGYPAKQQPVAAPGERQQGRFELPKGPGGFPIKSPQADYQGVTSQQLNGYPGVSLAKQPEGTSQAQRGGIKLPQGPGEYPGGYPKEQPLIPFPGTKPQQPNREYLPPTNGK